MSSSADERHLLERLFRCGRVELSSSNEQWWAAKALDCKGWARLIGPPYNVIEITAVGAHYAYNRALTKAGERYRSAVALARRNERSEGKDTDDGTTTTDEPDASEPR